MFGCGPLSQYSVTPIEDFAFADCAMWEVTKEQFQTFAIQLFLNRV